MSNTNWSFNAPPGWPKAPQGWVPPAGWEPDPSWPPVPAGWEFWLPESVESEDFSAAYGQQPAESPPVPPVGTLESAKRSWWTGRPAVGVVALLIGLGIGSAGGGDTEAVKDQAEKDAQAKIARIQGEAEELVDDVKEDALGAQEEAVDDAVAAAVAKEKARRTTLIDKAVTAAVKETKADLKAATPTEPKTLVSSTDPRFDTCGAANAAGYGNYRRGSDVEYGWYQDRDNDGVVCE